MSLPGGQGEGLPYFSNSLPLLGVSLGQTHQKSTGQSLESPNLYMTERLQVLTSYRIHPRSSYMKSLVTGALTHFYA